MNNIKDLSRTNHYITVRYTSHDMRQGLVHIPVESDLQYTLQRQGYKSEKTLEHTEGGIRTIELKLNHYPFGDLKDILINAIDNRVIVTSMTFRSHSSLERNKVPSHVK